MAVPARDELNSIPSLATTNKVVLSVKPKWASQDILGAAWAGGSTASVCPIYPLPQGAWVDLRVRFSVHHLNTNGFSATSGWAESIDRRQNERGSC